MISSILFRCIGLKARVQKYRVLRYEWGHVDGYNVWRIGGENKSLLLILLYKAAPCRKVFYTSMPQFVSLKGFHIEM